jgi:ribosome-binding ATPase
MGLGVGLVGLPNVGKSTTFNALTKAQNAQAANYPFCTIEPNKAVVEVPDIRIDELSKIVKPERVMHSQVEFVDIAGLVKGASKGEGLGNQFLGNIKEVGVVLHVVRCFEDDNVTHVENSVDPVRDIEIVETELLLADIQTLEKRIERLVKSAKTDKSAAAMLVTAEKLQKHLNEGNFAKTFALANSEEFEILNKELKLITAKELMYAANVDEASLSGANANYDRVVEHAAKVGADVIKICAKMEEELVSLDEADRAEFLAELGVSESGLAQIIRKGFAKLGLISYFTAGIKEVRAWTIEKGWKAPKSASVIHNDFEKGFIRAEVIAYNDFITFSGEQGAKEAGKMRLEGKEYIVADGDVMHFRFNI